MILEKMLYFPVFFSFSFFGLHGTVFKEPNNLFFNLFSKSFPVLSPLSPGL